jgi:serine/threonine protein kinase
LERLVSVDLARQHWERVKGVLADVLELAAEERASAISQASGDDLNLRDEVIRLLALHDPETIALNHAPLISNLVKRSIAQRAGPVAGDSIGGWRLLRPLGEGGMGSVWLATRVDASFQQQAAVKLIRGGGSALLLARLRVERQALAALNHANIAHLIDGGETASGEPYLVMEYVDGVPIDQWCQSQKLNARDCLTLFTQLVAAIAHAHERLLVHRDIKPSNVLVTAQGQLKLLDFGVTKLLASDSDTAAATEWGERALTPEYASPEQVQGGPITVATDVYGMAATLYRILTGTTPFVPPGSAKHDPFSLLKAVVEQPPTRASTAAVYAHPAANVRGRTSALALRGDIDTILNKALAKLPQDRYATAVDFGRDIRAHLDGFPITARAPAWHYLLRKFISRHRLASAAMAGALLSLLAGLAGALHQASVASAQRDVAQHEQARANAALEVAELERTRTNAALAAEQRERGTALAAKAQAEIQKIAAQAAEASSRRAQHQAETQRQLAAARFADVRELSNRVVSDYADNLLGTFGTSETRLKIINDSVTFLDRLRSNAGGDVGLLAELSRGYRKLAFALSGDASIHDYPRAGKHLAVARQLREHVIKIRGSTPSDVAEIALIDEAEGELARRQYLFALATPKLAQARHGLSQVADMQFSDPWDRIAPARAALHGAFALVEPGTTAESSATASQLLDEAQTKIESMSAENADDPVSRFNLSQVHYVRAILLRQRAKFEASEVQYDRAERIASELVNRFPNNGIYVQHWSLVLGGRKTLRLSNGREHGGFADGIKQAELTSMVRTREPTNPQVVLGDLVAWSGLCSDYVRLEKAVSLAEPACQRALESARAMLAMRHSDPFAPAAHQAMIVAGLAAVQSALAKDDPATRSDALAAALRLQAEALAAITQSTPAVQHDPLRTAYLINTRIAVGHGHRAWQCSFIAAWHLTLPHKPSRANRRDNEHSYWRSARRPRVHLLRSLMRRERADG